MSLHIIKDNLENSAPLQNRLRLAQADDVFILIENGVYNVCNSIQSALLNRPCYVLSADLEARGINNETTSHFQMINYAGFVALTEQHKKIITW